MTGGPRRDHSDGHSWFSRWVDAIGQADRRAALTRRRYRVHYDPANRWWNITETTEPINGGVT